MFRNKLTIILITIVVMIVTSCVESISSQEKKVKEIFIKEAELLTKKEALSKELDYHEPYINECRHTRSLNGKDLIHECNRVMKEDEEKEGWGPSQIKRIRRVWDLKDYAIEHSDEIVANEFYLVGTFTSFTGGTMICKGSIIYVYKLDRYIYDYIY